MKLFTQPVVVAGFAALLGALGTGCGSSSEGSGNEATDLSVSSGVEIESHRLPKLPDPSLAVPAGNRVDFVLDGVGVQIYTCQQTATGPAWVFQAPEANLYEGCGQIAGTHFAGPTWEANDGSTVVGAKIAAFTVSPTAVPWLLLQATSHTGDGRMSDITFVQRLQTTGGIAPATGCDAGHVGAVAPVGYTAKYVFYDSTDGG